MQEKYRVQNLASIDANLIEALINKYQVKEVPRLKRLKRYYLGNSDVKNRIMSDTTKPNNQISNAFSAYIVDTVVGYWLGKPVVYQSQDEGLLAKIQIAFDRNHEANHNTKIGKEIATTGIAYELIYLDEDKNIKMKKLNNESVFIIYDTTVEERPLMAVRYSTIEDYTSETKKTMIELYTDNWIQEGVLEDGELKLSEKIPHFFGKIPVVQYKNNDELTGSFEKVIDLIDSYDLAVSDTSNNIEYFADAYLVLSGMEATEPEDIQNMKENRVMILSEKGKAEWLVKGQASVEVEAFKDRLKEDIFTFSQVPNISDESFGNTASGISLQYKLFGLENIVSITERNFTSSLEKRLELITNMLNLMGGNHDHTFVKMTYTRNIPSNMTNLSDIISKLNGVVSHETLLTLLPFIDNPKLELDRIETELKGTLYENTFLSINNKDNEGVA